MAGSRDPDIDYVLTHPRFRGLSPVRRPRTDPPDYVIRIVDADGHELRITAPLVEVFAKAAYALRRLK